MSAPVAGSPAVRTASGGCVRPTLHDVRREGSGGLARAPGAGVPRGIGERAAERVDGPPRPAWVGEEGGGVMPPTSSERDPRFRIFLPKRIQCSRFGTGYGSPCMKGFRCAMRPPPNFARHCAVASPRWRASCWPARERSAARGLFRARGYWSAPGRRAGADGRPVQALRLLRSPGVRRAPGRHRRTLTRDARDLDHHRCRRQSPAGLSPMSRSCRPCSAGRWRSRRRNRS